MHASEELARALVALPVFAQLTPDDARALAGGCFVVEIQHDQLLFAEGQTPDHLYVLLEGEARITCLTASGDEVVVGRAHPGAVLGEMGLIDRAPRSASVRASGPARALQVPGARFGDLVSEGHPAAWVLLRAIREQLLERLRGVAERVDAVLEPPTEERDAARLREDLRALHTTLRTGSQ